MIKIDIPDPAGACNKLLAESEAIEARHQAAEEQKEQQEAAAATAEGVSLAMQAQSKIDAHRAWIAAGADAAPQPVPAWKQVISEGKTIAAPRTTQGPQVDFEPN